MTLDPFLFFMVADALGYLVQEALSDGRLEGVPIPCLSDSMCLVVVIC